MEKPEDFHLSKEKIYQVSWAHHNWDVVRFVKCVNISGELCYNFVSAREGFGEGKNLFVPVKYIYEIREFSTLDEFNDHYEQYEEEQKELRLKGEY